MNELLFWVHVFHYYIKVSNHCQQPGLSIHEHTGHITYQLKSMCISLVTLLLVDYCMYISVLCVCFVACVFVRSRHRAWLLNNHTHWNLQPYTRNTYTYIWKLSHTYILSCIHPPFPSYESHLFHVKNTPSHTNTQVTSNRVRFQFMHTSAWLLPFLF